MTNLVEVSDAGHVRTIRLNRPEKKNALSQQLAELRKAELVTTRRQAKQVYYSLADDTVVLCVRSIEAVFGAGDPEQALLSMVKPDVRPERSGIVRGAANFVRIR